MRVYFQAKTDDAAKAVRPFGQVEFYHPVRKYEEFCTFKYLVLIQGASYGPWLPSEFFAVIIFGLIWWAAYRERSKILG